MSGYDIGTARGVITMDYNGRGIKEAETDLEGLKKSGSNVDTTMKNTGKNFTRAGLAITAGLGLAVNTAASFEQRLSAVQAVSGATSSEMDKISSKALQLGKDTAFSASESAQAMEELVKAGLTVDDVLNGAADATVALAAAGEVDMPTAATIASNAMNQFNLGAEDMVTVADKIAGAANASAIDVVDLGESMQQVGAVAHLAGASFEDTATAIALMGNAGIKGSDAGTSLKSMLSRLQPTTKKQASVMEQLGIVTEDGTNKFYDAEGKLKSLDKVSGILSKSLKGMTKQEKQMALQTLFGSDAIRAAAVMADSGSKGFDKMTKSMDKVKAADVAKTRMDNFRGTLEQTLGSLETVGIQIGQILLPPINDLVSAIGGMIDKFSELSPGVQKAIVLFTAAAAAIFIAVGAAIKIAYAVKAIGEALKVYRAIAASAWVATLGPIALVIAAIIAVVAVIIILWKKSETFRKIVIGAWNAIKAGAAAVAAWFMGTFLPALVAVWDGIKAAALAIWNVIVLAVKTYLTIIMTVIKTYLAIIVGLWKAAWGLFGPLVKAVWGLIVAVIRLAWTIIKGVTILGIRAIKTAIIAGFNAVRSVTQRVWNAIKAVIMAVWSVIGPRVKAAVATIKSVISAAWNAIKSATSKIWNGMIKPITEFIGKAMNKVHEIRDKIVNFFSGAGTWLLDAGKKIVQGLIDGISSMIGKVTDKVNELTSKVKKFLPGSPVKEGPLKVLNRGYAGKQIVQMVIDGIESMAKPLAAAMETATAGGGAVAAPSPGASGKVRRRGASGDRSGLRLVDGELALDSSGRAFIRGVALDADDDNDEFDDLVRRMG